MKRTFTFKEVTFKKGKYILVKDAIATVEDFGHGLPSYAHIFGNKILRYGVQIGKKKDLKPTGKKITVKVLDDALFNLLSIALKDNK